MCTFTSLRWLVVAVSAAMLLMVAAACGTERVEVPGETVVVKEEVVKTVEVPGETLTVEVVKEVQVPGETVVVEKEVVKEVMVPGETVVVEKVVTETVEVPGETVTVEVVKEVMVPGETVVVEKEVVKEVMVPGETVVVEKVVTETVVVPGETVTVEVIKEVMVPGETVVVEKEVVKTVEVPVIQEVIKTIEVPAEPVMSKPTLPLAGSELIAVVSAVGVPVYHQPVSDGLVEEIILKLGLRETLLDYDGVALSGMIAPSWKFEDVDGVGGITWDIRRGVSWHDLSYGTVDAEDVIWTYEQMTREGTNSGLRAEWWLADYMNARALDSHTVRWDWREGPTLRWSHMARHRAAGTPISSKQQYEDLGEDYVNRDPIGTGPYKLVQHVDNDIIVLEGVKNHWRRNPGFETVKVIEVPEETTRIAMLSNGAADITMVTMSLLDQVMDIPGVRLDTGQARGDKSGFTINFGGNFTITHDKDGRPVEENTEFPVGVRPTDKPWVGDINDPESLANARKVRLAMSMAIDRQAIFDEIMGGASIACIAYFYTIDTCNPQWDKEWQAEHAYDPAAAKALLAEAGYPNGFEFTYWPRLGRFPTYDEIATAVAAMWENIGLNVNLDASPSSARATQFRERTLTDVWVAHWIGDASDPIIFTDFLSDQTFGLVNYSPGWDIPESYELVDAVKTVTNYDEFWAGPARRWYDVLHRDLFALGVMSWKDPWAVGPKVGNFDMHQHGRQIPELESLEPAR